MARIATWLTGLSLVGFASFAAAKGFELARFASIAQAAEASRATGRAAQPNDIPPRLAAAFIAADLETWRATSGVQDKARTLYLAALIQSGSARTSEIEEAAADVLAVEPTSSMHWLILAEARAQRGAPASAVLAAVDMSHVTGPREAPAMLMRLPIWLRVWEHLPDAERALVVGHLADLWQRLDPNRLQQLKTVLADKTPAARAEIRSALAARFDRQPAFLTALGL
jgi:hypothetical protein